VEVETSFVEEQAKIFLTVRRENPGDLIPCDLILQGGNIDNRIKTLLDALRIPNDCNEIDSAPEEGEDPFFCLLQKIHLLRN